MPRTEQIIPNYTVPHVATYINDNSVFTESTYTAPESGLRMLCVFASNKGEDRVLKTFNRLDDFVSEYGKPNFKKYGQPQYNADAALRSGNAIVHCMRVAPDNATYANVVISALVKEAEYAPNAAGVQTEVTTDATDGKKYITETDGSQVEVIDPATISTSLQVTFVSESIDGIVNKDTFNESVDALRERDATDGYRKIPIIGFISKGRGAYGSNFRVRFTNDIRADKENGYRNYILYLLEHEDGLAVKEYFNGTLIEYAVEGQQNICFDTLVNDSRKPKASNKINAYVCHENVEELYELYAAVAEAAGATPVIYDDFDLLTGFMRNSLNTIPYLTINTAPSSTELDARINALTTTDNNFARIDSISGNAGVAFGGGNDGDFAEKDADTFAMYLEREYKKAFTTDTTVEPTAGANPDASYYKTTDGTVTRKYDQRIFSKRAFPCEVILDANYSEEIKLLLYGLIAKRTDAKGYIDSGIKTTVESIITLWSYGDLAVIDDRLIEKEIQNYKVRDPYTGKAITVTTTYFIASKLPTHYMTYGSHVPFVGEQYALLSDALINSVRPRIDADDLEIKQTLYDLQLNCFDEVRNNTHARYTQVTGQTILSDLSDGNNMMVLLEMKRKLEDYNHSKLFNFAEASDRAIFTSGANELFTNYTNNKCRSYNVYFDMNEFEEQRSIIHCYLAVVFKTMAKRAIIEIDINKRV